MFLALDASSTMVGWAAGAHGVHPASGTKGLPNTRGDDGRLFHIYAVWLNEMITNLGPKRVAVEQSIMIPGRDDYETMFKLAGMVVTTLIVCCNRGLPCDRVPIATWRKAVLGQNFYPTTMGLNEQGRRKAFKDAAMKVCEHHGWSPRNDDEAEALCILHYLQSLHNPRVAAAKAKLAVRA